MPEPLTISQIVLNVLLSISASGIYDILKSGLKRFVKGKFLFKSKKKFNELSEAEKEELLKFVKANIIGEVEKVLREKNIQADKFLNVRDKILDYILSAIRDYNGAIDGKDKENFESFFNLKVEKFKNEVSINQSITGDNNITVGGDYTEASDGGIGLSLKGNNNQVIIYPNKNNKPEPKKNKK